MVKPALFLALSFVCSTLNAQIQNGIVREQNSSKRPISDAQVIFTDAAPAASDQAGNFRLVFSGKNAGDLIFLQEIAKKSPLTTYNNYITNFYDIKFGLYSLNNFTISYYKYIVNVY